MNNFFKHLFNILLQGTRFILRFLAEAVGLLASSSQATKPENDGATANAARGGALNFRTGKFDDGTDPAGWYEDN